MAGALFNGGALIKRGADEAPNHFAQTVATGETAKNEPANVEIARDHAIARDQKNGHHRALGNDHAVRALRVVYAPFAGAQGGGAAVLLDDAGTFELQHGFHKGAVVVASDRLGAKDAMGGFRGKPAEDQIGDAGVLEVRVEKDAILNLDAQRAEEKARTFFPEFAALGRLDAFGGDELKRRRP